MADGTEQPFVLLKVFVLDVIVVLLLVILFAARTAQVVLIFAHLSFGHPSIHPGNQINWHGKLLLLAHTNAFPFILCTEFAI